MRGIIFDLDDTLYRRADFVRSGFEATAQYVAESWRRERQAVLETLLAAHADSRRGREFQAVCEEHRLPLSVVPVLIKVFRKHHPSLALNESVRHTLANLRHDDWRIAVLTNGAPGVQRRKVAALGLDPLVDGVIYAEEHAPGGKPDPAVFRVALETLHMTPHRCVCVGDDLLCDIEGARAVGIRTIRVETATNGDRLLFDADAIVASVTEVPAYARMLLPEIADVA